MSLFDHHRANVAHLRGAAMGAAKAADAYGSIISDARRRVVVALNEMEGPLLHAPVDAASARLSEQASSLAGAAMVLEGAVTLWADAVEGFNRLVDELNDTWVMAVGTNFGVPLLVFDSGDLVDMAVERRAYDAKVASARGCLLHDLQVRHEMALEDLDRVARSLAGTLRGGPSVESLAFYADSGGLRDSAGMGRRDHGGAGSVSSAVFDPGWSDYTNFAVDLSKGVPGPFAKAMSGAADHRLATLTAVVDRFGDFDAGNWRPGSPWWKEFTDANTAWRRTAGLARVADRGRAVFEFLNKPVTEKVPKVTVADGTAAALTVLGIGYDYYVQHESFDEAATTNITATAAGTITGDATGDAVVAGGSMLAEMTTSAGASAAICSWAPVVGTIAGAVVGGYVGYKTYEHTKNEYEAQSDQNAGDSESAEREYRN